MQYIETDVRDSIQKVVNGNVVDSDFEIRDSGNPFDSQNSGESIYSLTIEIEELEAKLRAVFHSEKNAMVFEFSWINFCSLGSPTTQEVIEELQVYQDVRDEIEDIFEETPYEFANGVLSQDKIGLSRHPAVSAEDRFTPSLLPEGDSMTMSVGLAHKDTETPF